MEQRAQIDAAIGGEPPGWGDARTEREARAWAQRLDPHGAAERAAKAAVDRRVTVRSAPDCMTYVTALLPVKDGCAVFGELHRAALAGAGDGNEHRSKGQIMADELLRRVLTPTEGTMQVPGVEVHLVMTDRTLADADHEPAHLVGVGPIPAPVARDLVRADEQTTVWVRRMYSDPITGELAATDARRRDFPHVARMFLTARNQICRTPSGRSELARPPSRTEGGHRLIRRRRSRLSLCPPGRCAHPARRSRSGRGEGRRHRRDQRQRPLRPMQPDQDLDGWAALVLDGTIVTTTPTGHQYRSRAPRPPTSDPWTSTSAPQIPAIEFDLQWPGSGTSG